MRYYRLDKNPEPLEHNGQKVIYFLILFPEGVGIDEANAPVVGTETDLSNDFSLRLEGMTGGVKLHFDGKVYEYRSHLYQKSDGTKPGRLLIETEMGF